MLSGRGLFVGLITGPEESYRLWCVWVRSWNLDNDETLAHLGSRVTKKIYIKRSRDSSVSIVSMVQTGRSGVRIPAGNRDLSFLQYFQTTGVLSRGLAAWTWSWARTSKYYRNKECVELHKLGEGKTLPVYFHYQFSVLVELLNIALGTLDSLQLGLNITELQGCW